MLISLSALLSRVFGTCNINILERRDHFNALIKIFLNTVYNFEQKIVNNEDKHSFVPIIVSKWNFQCLLNYPMLEELHGNFCNMSELGISGEKGITRIKPCTNRGLRANFAFENLSNYNQKESINISVNNMLEIDDTTTTRSNIAIKGKAFQYKDYNSILSNLNITAVSIACVRVNGPQKFKIVAFTQNSRKRKTTDCTEVSFGYEIELITRGFTIKNSSYYGWHYFMTILQRNHIEIPHRNILNYGICLPHNGKNCIRFSDWSGIVATKNNGTVYSLSIGNTDCNEII